MEKLLLPENGDFTISHLLYELEDSYLAVDDQKVDNAIQQINRYPVNNAIIGFLNTHPLVSDLSGCIVLSSI